MLLNELIDHGRAGQNAPQADILSQEVIERVERELRIRGVALLEGVPLNPRFFGWREPGRRAMTNIALRLSGRGTLLAYIDDDVHYTGHELPADTFGAADGSGWQPLLLPPQTEVPTMLRSLSAALGLTGQPPQAPERPAPRLGEPEGNRQAQGQGQGQAAFQASADPMPMGGQPPSVNPPDGQLRPSPAVTVAAHRPQQAPEAARFFASQFGKNLTELAQDGKLGPVIGRDEETQAVIEILCKKGKNAPLLIGEPGVGKTAVAEGLALRVAAGRVPPLLRQAQLVEVNLGFLLAGTGVHGELEDRVRRLLEEAQRQPGLILFLDELHMISAPGMGGTVANMLKGDLARGTFKVIGATTYRDYKQHIEADGALVRRFQNVLVKEPSEAQALEILRGLRPALEEHHGVRLSEGILKEAVSLAVLYVSDRHLPDKAIDLLDEVCARTALQAPGGLPAAAVGAAAPAGDTAGPDGSSGHAAPSDLAEAPVNWEAAIEEAIRGGDYARAKQLHDQRLHDWRRSEQAGRSRA